MSRTPRRPPQGPDPEAASTKAPAHGRAVMNDHAQHRVAVENPLHGLRVGARDQTVGRIVRIVLQPGEQEAQFPVRLGRRAPVHLHARRTVGPDRSGELLQTDVDRPDPVREERGGRRRGSLSHRGPTI